MTEGVVGWSVLGRRNQAILVCARCMGADAKFDADLFGAADWAVGEGLATEPAAASEILDDHPEAAQPCTRCGEPLHG